ncbi:unnamed protein product, partial [Sphacelaria rigidula]
STPQVALESLAQPVLGEQHVPLVSAASTKQLRRMLDPGREAYQLDAALYLEVTGTCSFFYLTQKADGVVVDMRETIDYTTQEKKRRELLAAALGSNDGNQHAVTGRVPESR